jgi:oxygen-independent coproporphyrinogen-3 oxidase
LVADRDYLIDRFLNALQVELSRLDQRVRLETLFLGGGTPTHLNSQQLERLFQMLDQHFDFGTAEVTTEANPNDLTPKKIQKLIQLGVNRFSLGVQSFRDSKLQLLERDHNATQVREAVKEIQKYTPNISLDLIFATMGESQQQWLDDLRSAVELNPVHLSTYELTIEKGTQFWNRERQGQLTQVDEDQRADMYAATIETLAQAKLNQYEISSFAADGFQCQHNLVYWSGQPYLAFGAGASGYLKGVRETNHGSVSTYIKRLENGDSPVASRDELDAESRARELMIIGLRRIAGVEENDYQKRTGFDFDSLLASPKAQELFRLGLLKRSKTHLAMTVKGVLLYDSIAEVILAAQN